MDRETKSISKSVRMTPTVFNIVDKFEGSGFNEKFENLVLFCLQEENNIKIAIKEQKSILNRQAERKAKEIGKLDKIINSKKVALEDLKKVTVKADDLIRIIEDVTAGYK